MPRSRRVWDFINAKGNQNDTNFLKQFKISPEE